MSAVADIIAQRYGHHAMMPRKIRRRAAIVAVQKMQVLQEVYATCLDAIENQEVNAMVRVSSSQGLSLTPFYEFCGYSLGNRSDGGFDPDSVDWSDF